ncbi:hypothetical protein HJC23_011417, partial [Cyclotella cryptica]
MDSSKCPKHSCMPVMLAILVFVVSLIDASSPVPVTSHSLSRSSNTDEQIIYHIEHSGELPADSFAASRSKSDKPKSSKDPKSSSKATRKPTRLPAPEKEPKNICLDDPEDKYRTCFQRSADPSNNLSQDKILRHQYNVGARKFKRGNLCSKLEKSSGKSGKGSLSYVVPYSPPYVTSDEQLTHGSIYISIVQEKHVTMDCNNKIDLEETTLEWLMDNVGDDISFIPMCAFNDGNLFHKEVVSLGNGTKEVIKTAAFKMDLVFATKKDWLSTYETLAGNPFDRRQLVQQRSQGKSNTCNGSDEEECCCAQKILDSTLKSGRSARLSICEKKECSYCLPERRRLGATDGNNHTLSWFLRSSISPRQKLANIVTGYHHDKDYNDVLGDYTHLDPIETVAIVDATSLGDVAVCRANGYSATKYETPLMTCDDYTAYDCHINDFVVDMTNETLCVTNSLAPTSAPTKETSSLFPTRKPSVVSVNLIQKPNFVSQPKAIDSSLDFSVSASVVNSSNSAAIYPPTLVPSASPSQENTQEPTSAPSLSPSTHPTNSPSLNPSSSPSAKPSKNPTDSPFTHPSEAPTKSITLPPSRQPSRHPSISPSVHPSSALPTAEPLTSPSLIPSARPSQVGPNKTSNPIPGPPAIEPSFDFSITRAVISIPNNEAIDLSLSRSQFQPLSGRCDSSFAASFNSCDQERTLEPTAAPSLPPSTNPTSSPSLNPSSSPSENPSKKPTNSPSIHPSV